ncbi:MAG TPA: hypothetical protein VFA67_08695 [Candidatus Sulfotelmatobacter sp.]|nr:hypothetical protein [Candidatus Sulfotelmatobacter sp.]
MRHFTGLVVLSVLLAGSAFLHGQQPRQDENRPPRTAEPPPKERGQTEPRQAEPRPQPRRDEMNAPRREEAGPSRQGKQEQKQQERSRDQMKPSQQPTHARPAGRSAHIPDDKFHGQFGRAHTFEVRPVPVAQGQQGFVYSGYTFVFLDPWPDEWAYTDGCYVDYVDGDYFLYDLLHPGMRIALFVIM